MLNEGVATSLYKYIDSSAFACPTFLADPGVAYQLLYTNLACLDFGIQLATEPKSTLTEVFPTITKEKFDILWREVLERGMATILTAYYKLKGQLIYIELSLSQVVHENQELMLGYIRDATEQVKMLEMLATKEQVFRSLAASVPGFIYTLREDANGHFSFPYASVGIEELFGFSPEDVRDDANELRARYHPDDLSRVMAHVEKTKRELSPYCIEIRIIHPTKGLRWIEIRSAPVRLEDGATEWHGIMIDITERIQAKEAMLHTQNALKEAQRIAHIGSWDVDIVNDVLTWSDETFRIWEIDKTAFAATLAAFLETVHPDDREKVSDAYNQSIINKTVYQIEHRLLFPDGRVKYIQERGEPYYDETGRPVRFIGTALDITERKQFEKLVSMQNYALDHMGEAVYLVDESAQILYVNNAACEMLGYTQDELLAMRICDHDPVYDPSTWGQHWKDLLNRKTITLETVHKTKAGILVPIEVNANAIEHEGQHFNFSLVRDIRERKRIEAQMHHQASYDMLTGLPNRRLLIDRLREEISKAKRSGSNVAILFIDLDRFKEINDTLGHHQGDQVLIQAAQRIQQCVRESDTLARMGGDEFVVILSGITEMAHLGRVAQGIIEAMTSPFVLDNQISYVSASIGIANYPSDVDSLEGLISAADQAMYVAKERGRNGFSFFTPAMQKQVQQRLSLANDLREAIRKEQLQIYLQPIVNISTGFVVKAEALLRWKHPQHGMVPPDMFIPIAEETGMIHEIGDWVFHQAAHAMSRWLRVCTAKNDCCQISVNMSARQFIPSEIGTAWIKHLETINVPTRHMVIEITESLLLGDEVDIMGKLHRFRQAGIKVALDDFGTGYSAMSYLKKFNIDYLKIDRSFVRDLETDTNDRAITEAIVVMAHKLGLKTIAEGVETEQQKAILAEVGCDYVQGYFYAKPMPVEEFLSFVQIKA
ncbi:MAG: EAL domain-containing protein [Methylophilus sp.]|nr:EAL domain-containing protein [Methylophilus sp.]